MQREGRGDPGPLTCLCWAPGFKVSPSVRAQNCLPALPLGADHALQMQPNLGAPASDWGEGSFRGWGGLCSPSLYRLPRRRPPEALSWLICTEKRGVYVCQVNDKQWMEKPFCLPAFPLRSEQSSGSPSSAGHLPGCLFGHQDWDLTRTSTHTLHTLSGGCRVDHKTSDEWLNWLDQI